MSTLEGLRQRVQERDRLVQQAEESRLELREGALAALRRGDLRLAEAAILRHESQVAALAESLRIYQAELHAQADELVASQARAEALLSRFSALFTAMPVAALLVAADGGIVEHNQRAAALFDAAGAPAPTAQRPTPLRLLHRLVDADAWQRLVRPALNEARAAGASALDAVQFVTVAGRRFSGEMHLSLLEGGAGAAPLFACAVIDRSEHLADLQALREAAQALRLGEAVLADSARLARVGGWRLVGGPHPRLLCSPQARELLQLAPDALHPPVGDGIRSDAPGQAADAGPGRGADAAGDALPALLQRCTPSSRQAFGRALQAALRHGRPLELELDLAAADGQPLRLRAVAHRDARRSDDGTAVDGRGPVDGSDDDGAVVLGVFQDVTAQHLSRRRIQDLTDRLALAQQAGGIGVWDWDLAAGRLICDSRMHELLQSDAGAPALPAAVFEQALHPDDARLLRQAVQHSVDSGRSFSVQVRRLAASGGSHAGDGSDGGSAVERWLHLTGRAQEPEAGPALPPPGAGAGARATAGAPDAADETAGPPTRVVGCAWDCSAEKQAARALAEKVAAQAASRAKSEFLSRMSHELRTPLNAILGFVQLMRLEAEAGDLTLKPHRVVLMETAARHLLDLINEVLDVSRVEAGQVDVRLRRLDLREVLGESLPLVLQQAAGAGIVLHDAVSGGAPLWVRADRLRLKQVLINLLSNAVKYNRPAGTVTVAARTLGAEVALTVADTGRGLDAAQRAALYQPFNRLGAESTAIEGSGMGLFVCRRFVELMGGRIEVDSVPGQGSTFTVLLQPAPDMADAAGAA